MEEKSSLFSEETDQMDYQHTHQPYSQSVLGNDFMYQQSLFLHNGSVRALASLDSGYLLSGSIDRTNKLFILNNATGKYDYDKEFNYHTEMVNAVQSGIDGNGFFTGSKDKKIFRVDLQGNPVMIYEGHESTVNSLSQSIPEELVSGSWDGTARIWDVETGKEKQSFPGHSHAVSVLSLENGVMITGSQDKKIRLFHKGIQQKEFIAHDDIIRAFTEVPAIGGFASCSNDEKIKLWTIDGQLLQELQGHSSFVFTICTMDSGEIISGGEDCTVRVWKDGACSQIITHPKTIWSVTKNHLGDIITGSEDYKIRTFTRDFARREEGEGLKDFEAECQAAALGTKSDIEVDKLPDVGQLSKMPGKKDGEIRVFKNKDNAEAYVWKGDSMKWEKIGDVVNPSVRGSGGGGTIGAGSTQSARFYEGDRLFEAGEYDHIYDIDLGDGLMRKLPFDNGGNCHEAADKFIVREIINRSFVEQIVSFIKNNSIPYKTSDYADQRKGLAQSQQQNQQHQQVKKSNLIPMKKPLYFDAISVDPPKKKLIEFNNELKIISDTELVLVEQLFTLIKEKQFYHSSKVSKQGYEVIKKMFKFPKDKLVPTLDFYRMFLMHPSSSDNYKVFEHGMEYLGYIMQALREESSPQNTQLMALRCFANMFNNPTSLFILLSKRQIIMDTVCGFLFNENKNIRNAAITIVLNYSISFTDKNDADGRIQCISGISEIFATETDSQNYFRLTIALGNLGHGDEEALEMIQTMGIKVNLKKIEGGDEKTLTSIKEVAQDLQLEVV